MKIVGTRLDSYIDDGPGSPAILGSGILFGFELVNGIHRQDRPRISRSHNRVENALAHPRVGRIDPVHHVDVVLGAQAVGALGPA